MKQLFIALIISSLSMTASAFPFNKIEHDCNKPLDWGQGYDQWEIDQYKECIEEFLEETKEAQEEAVDDWNEFVRELNYSRY